MSKQVGIPYAFEHMKNGKVFAECPICGEHIELKSRKDFESFSGNEYQQHYMEHHAPEEMGGE